MSEARAVAVIVDGSRVLVSEQHEAQVKGMAFSLPGGYPKAGESLEACLARIVKEHIGIQLQVKRLVYVAEHLWHHAAQDHHEVGLYFLCGIRGGIETDPDGNVHARDPKYHPKLLEAEMIDAQRLYPPFLRRELLRDLRGAFKEGVKHLVDDQRPR
jgi:ADP-ribose pyrophosphatase YjhB (NUDIX family)